MSAIAVELRFMLQALQADLTNLPIAVPFESFLSNSSSSSVGALARRRSICSFN
jgi:hypothetical protein